MIAANEDGLGKFVTELNQPVNGTFDVRPPIHIIAKENKLVTVLGLNQIEQAVKLVQLTVYIADGDQSVGNSSRHQFR